SGDLALRYRATAGNRSANRGGDAGIVLDDGRLALESADERAESDVEFSAYSRAGHRSETFGSLRFVLPDWRCHILDPSHRHGTLRRRPEADEAFVAASGRRWAIDGEHPEVPAQGAECCRLPPCHIHCAPAGTAVRRFSRRGMRLEQARRRPATSREPADVRERARGRLARPVSDVHTVLRWSLGST